MGEGAPGFREPTGVAARRASQIRSQLLATVARIAAVATMAAAAASARAQCGDAARVEGTAVLASLLRDALRSREARFLEHASCVGENSVVVDVTLTQEGRIRVVLRGPDGSNAMREVDRMTTAALLVESWIEATRLDLLEAPRVHGGAGTVEGIATTTEASTEAEVGASLPTPEPTAVVAVASAAAIAAFGNEGSSWFGVELSGCARAGPTCIGGSLRYLSDSGLSDGSSTEDGQRNYVGADVDLSLPFGVGTNLTLTPTVALGLGWLDVVVTGRGRPVIIDSLRATVSASFAGAVALAEWLSLELRLAAAWSPLARQMAWMTGGLNVDPDPVVLASVMLGVRGDIR